MYKLILILFFCDVSDIKGDMPENESNLQNLRIVGGQSAAENSVPYQASLRSSYYWHFCGGAVLNNRWILTAAHCTVGITKDTMTVVVGTNSLIFGGDRYSVDDIKIHEQYNQDLIYNDVSLIKVSMDIEFSHRVQPIPLPDANTNAGAKLLLSGWGKLSYPGVLPLKLQVINLRAISVEECQSVYRDTNPVYDTQICTLPEEEGGACEGDSGGPLVEDGNIVGVVSWGIPCGRGYPDVNTRIFSFKEWITEKMSVTSKNESENLIVRSND